VARLIGQRWVFDEGNARIVVDNAFSWLGLAQERLVVNGETVQKARAVFSTRRDFLEPWLTLVGDEELRVALKSRILSISCTVTLGGRILTPVQHLTAQWTGIHGSWPEEDQWKEAVGRKATYIAQDAVETKT
jgi:hypothetical protein